MFAAVVKPDTHKKLQILSAGARYDLACACSASKDQHRKRAGDGKWLYPVTLLNGSTSVLLKTLLSNVCTNDCKYCPLREQADIPRCTLTPEETAKVFWDYLSRRKVFGLFLSSAVLASPDNTMDKLNATAKILRNKYSYRGYIHLKIIPGASDAAIEESLSLASAVSLNIETPGGDHLAKLSSKKDYIRDIIEPIRLISSLTSPGSKYARTKQTTQFIVGAAGESDTEIVKYLAALYDRLNMNRVYFSAYQKGAGDDSITGEKATPQNPADIFIREHRLYQVDFLLRRYSFKQSDIIFDDNGNLSLSDDPKQIWASNHPESFPVNVNSASKFALLRVPGLGPVTVRTILHRRRQAKLSRLEDIAPISKRLLKATQYLTF